MARANEIEPKEQEVSAMEEAVSLPRFEVDADGNPRIVFINNEQQDYFLGLFGTGCPEVSQLFLNQLANASGEGVDLEKYANAILPLLKAIGPQDELEAMLAVQMIGTHFLSMEMMKRVVKNGQSLQEVTSSVNSATKLSRTFLAQLEALNRHRGKVNKQQEE